MQHTLTLDETLALNNNIEELVQRFKLDANHLKEAHTIKDSEEIRKILRQYDSVDKKLKIAIMGRVKAGKSTFLNSLIFDGKDVLPEAATPMTASLTLLKYQENDSNSLYATAEFFQESDIEDIKKEHDSYVEKEKEIYAIQLKKFQELEQKKGNNPKDQSIQEDIKQRAERSTKRELQNDTRLAACYDQYKRMEKSGILHTYSNEVEQETITTQDEDGSIIEEKRYIKRIEASDYKDLRAKLNEYVGSTGKYMPFTKSITLELKQDSLKEVEIIDTPGTNDPIVSREERTKELVKECDVMIFLSPSSQFGSQNDMDWIDRVSTKEGLQEFRIIASRIDEDLFGSERDKAGGDLYQALESIQTILKKQCDDTFKAKKQSYEKEYPTLARTIDKILENRQLLLTSGISYNILQNYENKADLNESASHTLSLLQSHYPSYFDSTEKAKQTLAKLANIDVIRDNIAEIIRQKDKIIEEKKANLLQSTMANIKKYKEELQKYQEERLETLKNTDKNRLEKQRNELIALQDKITITLEDSLQDNALTFKGKLKNTLYEALKRTSNIMQNKQDRANETISQDYKAEVTKKVDDSTWWNPLSWGRKKTITSYETRTRMVETLKVGVIIDSIKEFRKTMQDELNGIVDKNILRWKKDLQNSIFISLREAIGDDDIEPTLIKKGINEIITSIKFDKIKTISLPRNLKKSGILDDEDEIEEFKNEIEEYLENLREKFESEIEDMGESLYTTITESKIASNILNSYDKELEQLQQDLQDKEQNIQHYEEIIAAIKAL